MLLMKRIVLTLSLLLGVVALYAQNPYIALVGASESATGGVDISAPQTVLTVDVVAVCERTVAGPYARYAQKYLGVRAPLTDKSEWRVEKAQIGLGSEELFVRQPLVVEPQTVASHTDSFAEFSAVLIDKSSSVPPTLESAAQAAANTIFKLRHHRRELITGEAGEHVLGEGLKAALDELNRQEQAYLELFLGKTTTTSRVERYVVVPEADKKQYVVCRFSREAGLLPSTDLTGNMVVLQITPAENVASPVPEAGVKETATTTALVANRAPCTLLASGEEVAREVLPIFAFGRYIQVALPKRK